MASRADHVSVAIDVVVMAAKVWLSWAVFVKVITGIEWIGGVRGKWRKGRRLIRTTLVTITCASITTLNVHHNDII